MVTTCSESEARAKTTSESEGEVAWMRGIGELLSAEEKVLPRWEVRMITRLLKVGGGRSRLHGVGFGRSAWGVVPMRKLRLSHMAGAASAGEQDGGGGWRGDERGAE